MRDVRARVELALGCWPGEDPGMPTVPRRPAHNENVTDSKPAGCAAELFAAGVR